MTLVARRTTLLAGCEVNLNTEGLSARELKTFKVTGQPEVVLDTFDGAIELHSWDRNEIEVEVEKRAMEQVAPRRDQGRRAAAGRQDHHQGHRPGAGRSSRRHDRHAHFTDGAPARRGAAQRQHQRDERRRLDPRRSDRRQASSCNTSDGSVTGTRLGGDIQIRSGDGSIRIDNATGKLDLETDDGSIGVEARPTRAARADRRRIGARRRSSPTR